MTNRCIACVACVLAGVATLGWASPSVADAERLYERAVQLIDAELSQTSLRSIARMRGMPYRGRTPEMKSDIASVRDVVGLCYQAALAKEFEWSERTSILGPAYTYGSRMQDRCAGLMLILHESGIQALGDQRPDIAVRAWIGMHALASRLNEESAMSFAGSGARHLGMLEELFQAVCESETLDPFSAQIVVEYLKSIDANDPFNVFRSLRDDARWRLSETKAMLEEPDRNLAGELMFGDESRPVPARVVRDVIEALRTLQDGLAVAYQERDDALSAEPAEDRLAHTVGAYTTMIEEAEAKLRALVPYYAEPLALYHRALAGQVRAAAILAHVRQLCVDIEANQRTECENGLFRQVQRLNRLNDLWPWTTYPLDVSDVDPADADAASIEARSLSHWLAVDGDLAPLDARPRMQSGHLVLVPGYVHPFIAAFELELHAGVAALSNGEVDIAIQHVENASRITLALAAQESIGAWYAGQVLFLDLIDRLSPLGAAGRPLRTGIIGVVDVRPSPFQPDHRLDAIRSALVSEFERRFGTVERSEGIGTINRAEFEERLETLQQWQWDRILALASVIAVEDEPKAGIAMDPSIPGHLSMSVYDRPTVQMIYAASAANRDAIRQATPADVQPMDAETVRSFLQTAAQCQMVWEQLKAENDDG